MKKTLTDLEEVFRAMSDETRIRIVGLLLSGEVCVCHIHETLKVPQSKASRHLAYLRRAGIVTAEKRGLWVYYRLNEKKDHVLAALLSAVRHCIGHLDVVKADGQRLERKTGCCVPEPAALTLDCCRRSADAGAAGSA